MTSQSESQYTHTVHCFDDPSLRKHFMEVEAASRYANELLGKGHQVKIYPYQLPKKHIDYIAENPEEYQ